MPEEKVKEQLKQIEKVEQKKEGAEIIADKKTPLSTTQEVEEKDKEMVEVEPKEEVRRENLLEENETSKGLEENLETKEKEIITNLLLEDLFFGGEKVNKIEDVRDLFAKETLGAFLSYASLPAEV